MFPKAPIHSVFLLTTLVSCTTYIDDQDGTPSLFWSGSWGRYGNLGSAYTELAWQGTLSLGNQSGATVIFTFTGTSVGVFGSLWPGETGVRSTYAIDNGRPTEFVPPGLQEPARLQFYASGALPEGEHTLKVTNLGSFLWLDYFEYDDVVPSSTAGSGTTTSSPKATTAQPSSTTTTTTTRPSPVTITTTASPSHDVGGPLSSTTSQPSTSASSQTSAPRTSPTESLSSSSSATAAPPSLNPITSSAPSASSPSGSSGTSSSSPNAPPPPQDAAAPEAHTHQLSRGARVGLIAATTAGGVALLALVLVCFVRRRRARSRLRDAALPTSQNLKPAPSSSSSGLEGDTLHSPTTTTSRGGGASLFSTTMMSSLTTTAAPSTARSTSMCQTQAGEVQAMDASHSCHACAHQPHPPASAIVGPPVRATDGGVSVAGGRLRVSNVHVHGPAPSIFEVEEEGEKSTLPPPYPGQD